MTISSQLAQISAVVGMVLPIAVSFIMKENWSQNVKKIVACAACVVAALVVTAAKGAFNFHDLVGTVLIVFTLAKVSYLSLYRNTALGTPKIKQN